MILECLPNGMFESNCYVLGVNGEGVIIDAGVDVSHVLKIVESNKLKIKYIILTHGHIDHICQIDKLRAAVGGSVAIHEKDADFLTNPVFNCSFIFGTDRTFKPTDITLKDGDVLKLNDINLEIIHTPGHTPGGMCIKSGGMVFTGDTLFRCSTGRTDLPGGSRDNIVKSIKNKLFVLPDETLVYPGHNDASTIGFEKRNNII
jgi:glyoxylase-like metal-dependent hydrolase (beta-lactamase superfamily II)